MCAVEPATGSCGLSDKLNRHVFGGFGETSRRSRRPPSLARRRADARMVFQRLMSRTIPCAALLSVMIGTAACGRTESKLTELQRARSGIVDVVLLSAHEGLRHGTDAFVIEFRLASDERLVDVGDVRGSATMPMPGMPMFGSIDIQRTDLAGRYRAEGRFDMAGTWRMTVQWQGSSGEGSVTFSGTVQ